MTAFFVSIGRVVYSWVGKLMFIGLLATLWVTYGQTYQEDLTTVALWVLSRSILPYMTSAQAQYLADFIALMISWGIISWILPHGHPAGHHSGTQGTSN